MIYLNTWHRHQNKTISGYFDAFNKGNSLSITAMRIENLKNSEIESQQRLISDFIT